MKYHDGIVFHAAYFDGFTRRSGAHVLSVAVTRLAPAVIAVMFVDATGRVIDAGVHTHYRLGATYSPIPQVVGRQQVSWMRSSAALISVGVRSCARR